MLEYGDHIGYAFEYSTSLFKEETIREFSRAFEQIIRQVTENTGVRIARLSPLGKEELAGIHSFQSTGPASEPFFTIPQLFGQQVKQTPDNAALEFKGNTIGYDELDRKASQVAGVLQRRGVRKGELVGVHMKRSPELVM